MALGWDSLGVAPFNRAWDSNPYKRGYKAAAMAFSRRKLRRTGQFKANGRFNPKRVNIRRGSGYKDAQPLTSHHDYTTQYRKRRSKGGFRQKRKVQRAKRFRKSVLKVEESFLGARIHLHTGTGSPSWANNGGTTWAMMLNILHQTGSRELTLEGIRNSMLSNNASLRKTTKFYLRTSCLDISLTARAANTSPVDLDVYVIVAKKTIPFNGLGSGVDSFAAAETLLPNTNLGQIPVTDAGVAVARTSTTATTSTVGWTPWLSPNFCSYWTVLSKKKILLTPGSTTHLQLKKTYNRLMSFEDIDKYDVVKGLTFGYLFNANGTYNGTNQPLGIVDFNFEQYYTVKMTRDSEDTVVLL